MPEANLACNFSSIEPTINQLMKAYRDGLLLVAAGLLVFVSACGHKHSKVKTARQPHPQHPISVPIGTTEQGVASWYGIPYHGRPAADGEIFDMEQLVAAHRT